MRVYEASLPTRYIPAFLDARVGAQQIMGYDECVLCSTTTISMPRLVDQTPESF